MSAAETRYFVPGRLLADDNLPRNSPRPDLVILNQPIASFEVFRRVWRHAGYRICADGGANRLYDMFIGELEGLRDDFLPDSIHGDLDSLREDVAEYYACRDVRISKDPDQETTDFEKSMQLVSSRRPVSSQREVIVLSTLGGRVDQGLGLLHELIREETRDQNLRLWVFSESSVSFVLRSPQNIIQELRSSGFFTRNVGIVPIYGPAVITTSGLEYDVRNWDTQMGHRVSTSNHVIEDEVRVQTNNAVLFTIERAPLPKTSSIAESIR